MKQKNLILMVVAVGCGLVAAFLTTRINAKPKVETVDVFVAVKDLPVGTTFTKEELGKLVTKKKVAKDSLPPAFVVDEQEFYDKRLTRAVMKEETFNPGTLSKGGVITLPEGFDLATLPLTPGSAVAGFVTPGAKVDVLATMRLNNRLKAFPLLVDMLVLAVDNHIDTTKSQTGVFPTLSSVSFAATQEQALLLALAKQRGCHMELLLRHPGKPVDPTYDIKQVIKLIQDEKSEAKLYKTEGNRSDEITELPILPTPIAPDPQVKEEEVKVWVAVEKIPAGTEFSKELVEKKLKAKEMPRRYAIGAYSDLAPLVDQKLTLKTDLNVDQWVADTIVGPSISKPSPREDWTPPKTGVVTEPKVATPVARKIHDTAVHTPNGTLIHRFEEVAPGVWKLKAILTQEEATKSLQKDPVTPGPKKVGG